MSLFKKKKKVVTHDGSFHPDDVFAVAVISLFEKGCIDIQRTRDERFLKDADYVVDVGGIYDPDNNLFDHHQPSGAGMRADGSPYAAFGLVWKKFGILLSESQEAAERIEKRLVEPTDILDNGSSSKKPLQDDIYQYDLSSIIFAFHSTWKEKERSEDDAFFDLVKYAELLLVREIKKMSDKIEGEAKVQEIYEKTADKRIIELDADYSWGDVLKKYPEPLFVITPENGNFHVRAVRDNPNEFKNRCDFPASWAGLRGSELAKITGVPDAVFCHSNRFLAVAKSKAGAETLAELALK